MIDYHMITKTGTREQNEDSAVCLNRDEESCFVVADGLGGHGKGEVASALAIEAFRHGFETLTNLDELLDVGFQAAQDRILLDQKEQHAAEDMKTTCAALLITGGRCRWGHIGDTRVYAFRKNKVKVRTLDHSVTQMMVFTGDIKEKQIRNHPDRNRLLRVMGTEWTTPRYELAESADLDEYQAFLLCSDGFWELIDEKAMGAHLKKSQSAEDWLERMTADVEKSGAGKDMDNYTAITVVR